MKKNHISLIISLIILTIIAGCSDDKQNNSAGSASPGIGFVATRDTTFTAGNLTSITGTSPTTVEKGVLGATGLKADSVLKSFGHFLYVLQRLGSNSIVVIDSKHPDVPLANYSVNDPGSTKQANPHDMAFVSDSKAYVTRYDLGTLLIVNPLTGKHLDTIDLSAFDDDGIPEMDKMLLIGDLLYVSLQRLDNFKVNKGSYIVVIDTQTDQVVEASPGKDKIVLEGRNPFGGMFYLASTNRIYLAHTSEFFTSFSTDDPYGGIEVVNPDTGLSEGMLIPDESFGGGMGNILILSETVAYATFANPSDFKNFVAPFNPTTKEISASLTGISTAFLPSLAVDNAGFLYIADRDKTSPGLQVFDTTTNEKVGGPVNTGLPPSDIVFVATP